LIVLEGADPLRCAGTHVDERAVGRDAEHALRHADLEHDRERQQREETEPEIGRGDHGRAAPGLARHEVKTTLASAGQPSQTALLAAKRGLRPVFGRVTRMSRPLASATLTVEASPR